MFAHVEIAGVARPQPPDKRTVVEDRRIAPRSFPISSKPAAPGSPSRAGDEGDLGGLGLLRQAEVPHWALARSTWTCHHWRADGCWVRRSRLHSRRVNDDSEVSSVTARYPPADITPAEFESFVAELLGSVATEVEDLDVRVLDTINGVDGSYVFDATVRFTFATAFRCASSSRPSATVVRSSAPTCRSPRQAAERRRA